MVETETIIRAMQWYLLVLSAFTFVYAIAVGPQINKLRFTGAHIYYAYILIFVLSIAQIKQCVGLLGSPVGGGWWYPFFCKQLSLYTYIAILLCIKTCRQCKEEV